MTLAGLLSHFILKRQAILKPFPVKEIFTRNKKIKTFIILSISRQTSAGEALHSLSDQFLSQALPRAVSLFSPVCVGRTLQ